MSRLSAPFLALFPALYFALFRGLLTALFFALFLARFQTLFSALHRAPLLQQRGGLSPAPTCVLYTVSCVLLGDDDLGDCRPLTA